MPFQTMTEDVGKDPKEKPAKQKWKFPGHLILRTVSFFPGRDLEVN